MSARPKHLLLLLLLYSNQSVQIQKIYCRTQNWFGSLGPHSLLWQFFFLFLSSLTYSRWFYLQDTFKIVDLFAKFLSRIVATPSCFSMLVENKSLYSTLFSELTTSEPHRAGQTSRCSWESVVLGLLQMDKTYHCRFYFCSLFSDPTCDTVHEK